MFTTRTDWELIPNNLSRVLARVRDSGVDLVDLTLSNPTRCGFSYASDAIRAALSQEEVLLYDPNPRGLLRAREAIVEYYAQRGAAIGPEQVVLTASTSEAYSHLFKLLVEPREEVMVPVPSYPLFEYLAALADAQLSPYPRSRELEWDDLSQALTEITRAVLAVNPSNPSGVSLSANELPLFVKLCGDHELAWIVDEVFLDYAPEATTCAAQDEVLTFTMSGLSKVCGLPQLKLGWIVVTGPAQLRDEALSRLEVIADTYLSVNAPVQIAAPQILATAKDLQDQINERTRINRSALEQLVAPLTKTRITSDAAGWYAVLRVPAPDEEELVLQLLETDHVLVHPGYFYDYSGASRLVVSLLPPPDRFRTGASRVIDRLQ